MDRIHKPVQVFLHYVNTAAIEDVESGGIKKCGGLQKRVERGYWLTLTPVWVDRPAQNEEGRRKSDVHGMGARTSDGGGGRDTVFNYGVDLHLKSMDGIGDMTSAARSENLHIPLAEDVREICLHFLSKRYCIRSFTRSHAPVQENNREEVMRYIRVGRDVIDPSRKRKFNGGGDQGSHREYWERSEENGTRNPEGQNHRNGAGFGGR